MGIVFLLDFYIFRVVLNLFPASNSAEAIGFMVIYWLIPVGILFLIGIFNQIAQKGKPLSSHWRTAGSFALILYLGKILMAMGLFLGDIVRFLIGVTGYFTDYELIITREALPRSNR